MIYEDISVSPIIQKAYKSYRVSFFFLGGGGGSRNAQSQVEG